MKVTDEMAKAAIAALARGQKCGYESVVAMRAALEAALSSVEEPSIAPTITALQAATETLQRVAAALAAPRESPVVTCGMCGTSWPLGQDHRCGRKP